VLRNTVPGVPDLYQGCEFEDLSLVDPDNRRPVDFDRRASSLEAKADEKQLILNRLLEARRQDPELWQKGNYVPLVAGNCLAFARQFEKRSLSVLLARQEPAEGQLDLAPGTDLLTGRRHPGGPIACHHLLTQFPAALLYHQS
jgi:(1->4)-alpha-D-glucan 1-alpha-D-glucosylmutase